MMMSPSDVKRKTETIPAVVRTSALRPPSRSPGSRPRTAATMTMMIAVPITHDPNIDTIVLQFAEMPVASATTSARLDTFTSSTRQSFA